MAEGSSVEVNNGDGGGGGGAGHPYDFHVAGPRSIAAPTWRDLVRSSWKNPSYRRMVIACFIQAVYLLEALKTAVDRHGSSGVCVGGHSLGAGFALQVGKALAKQGVFVECHLFNPPSVSLVSVGEKLSSLWKRVKGGGEEGKASESEATRLRAAEAKKWMPHLYVNNCDYVCCYYNDQAGSAVSGDSVGGSSVAKLYVMSRGPTKFLEAHGLQQWWSDDAELELALRHGRLINRQLRSLYSA